MINVWFHSGMEVIAKKVWHYAMGRYSDRFGTVVWFKEMNFFKDD